MPNKGGAPQQPQEMQVQLQHKARAPAPVTPPPPAPEKEVQTREKGTYDVHAVPRRKVVRRVASAPQQVAKTPPPRNVPSSTEPAQAGGDVEISGLDDAFAHRTPQTNAPPKLAMHLSDLPKVAPPADAPVDVAQRAGQDPMTKNWGAIWEQQVRRKVERMGEMNFPKDKHDRPIFGIVEFRLLLNYDGSIAELSITESSGNPELDEKALGILRMAAPLPKPFPQLLDKHGQVLLQRYYQFINANARWYQ